MSCLFVSNDKFCGDTSGSKIVDHELEFLRSIYGDVDTLTPHQSANPFESDVMAMIQHKTRNKRYRHAHFYAGTFSTLIKNLKEEGTKVSYTCAAHDIDISWDEHKQLGWGFDYPHLTDPELRKRYLQGYCDADLVIATSTYSKEICDRYGCKNIVVIPHGVEHIPNEKPLPKHFSVGYLGSPGADKGLRYLIEAWKKLNYKDCYLKISGKATEQLWPLVRQIGGGAIYLSGYVKDIKQFYQECSIYCQPSATEGFGLEILEAMSFGRPVVSTTNNGGRDVISDQINGRIVAARNSDALAEAINYYKSNLDLIKEHGRLARDIASNFLWSKIRNKYIEAWSRM